MTEIEKFIIDNEITNHDDLRDLLDTKTDGSDYWDYPSDERDYLLDICRDESVDFDSKYVGIEFCGEIRYYEYYEEVN